MREGKGWIGKWSDTWLGLHFWRLARPVLEARLARVKDAALSPAYA